MGMGLGGGQLVVVGSGVSLTVHEYLLPPAGLWRCICHSGCNLHSRADLQYTQGLIQLQAIFAFCIPLNMLTVGDKYRLIPCQQYWVC